MMTPRRARQRLPLISAQIEKLEARTRSLYAERLEAFKALTDDGDTQQEIADQANSLVLTDDARIGAPAVAFALHKARKRSAESLNGAS